MVHIYIGGAYGCRRLPLSRSSVPKQRRADTWVVAYGVASGSVFGHAHRSHVNRTQTSRLVWKVLK